MEKNTKTREELQQEIESKGYLVFTKMRAIEKLQHSMNELQKEVGALSGEIAKQEDVLKGMIGSGE